MNLEQDTIKCTWKLGDKIQDSPHIHEQFHSEPKKIYQDVLDAIGKTPMVKINKFGRSQGIECELLAKCEFMSIGGSVKDRVGRRMVLDAQKNGILKPGSKIVEPTSGNTGIIMALVSAVRGYQCTICLPEKMSDEKANTIKGLGAKLIRTPTEALKEDPQSSHGVAKRMAEQDGYTLLNQYCNPSNPIGKLLKNEVVRKLIQTILYDFMFDAFFKFSRLVEIRSVKTHYDSLAEEILYQCDGNIDAIVIGTGTGGVMTGVARKIKERSPNTQMVAADPFGSLMAMPQAINKQVFQYKVEGIGHDFIPNTCQRTLIDHWVKTQDKKSFLNARELMKDQGLLVGGSSGSVMQAAKEFIKLKGWEKDKTKRIVCIFSDSIRNYMTKFVSSEWCVENGFLPFDTLDEEGHIFSELTLQDLNLPEIVAYEDLTILEAKQLFQKGAKIIPLKNNQGQIIGAITPRKFVELINLKKLGLQSSALKAKASDVVIVPHTLSVVQLQKLLERNNAVLVETKNNEGVRQKLQIATIESVLKFIK